jgi:NTP pyrophosphatase (non-canonical NTP hydrolase)
MKKIQDKIKNFCIENNLNCSVESRMLDLVSEVGEVSKEILLANDYGKTTLEKNNNIESELGDVFFSLIVLSNTLDVDLEKVLDMVLEKYEKRLINGSIGSESD